MSARRGLDANCGLEILGSISRIVQPVERDLYLEFESTSKQRMAVRDLADWPVVATALLLDAPIWTEDRDFFGSGIATWTSNRVEIFLRDS